MDPVTGEIHSQSVSRKGPARTWSSRSRGPALGNRIFMALIAAGGTRPAYLLLRAVALWYALVDRRTTAALRHFRRNLGAAAGFTGIYRHIVAFGESLVDGYAFLCRRTPPFSFNFEGEEHLRRALEGGMGLILVSAHIGSWEIAGNLLFDRLDRPVNFIMLDEDTEAMRRVFEPAIRRRRINIIPVTTDPLAMMIAVRAAPARNEILCVSGDRFSGSEETRLLPFLGEEARFPAGPFVFSAVTGAPMIAVFSVKERSGHYLLKVAGMMDVTGTRGSRRTAAMEEAMRRYVAMVEQEVRRHPEQWFNMYEFWG